jgi:Flp pilus assembly protein TadG
MSTSGRPGERGSVTLELILVTPLLVMLLLLAVGVGRLVTARADVDGTARAAARAASIRRDPGSADRAARQMAVATLAERHLTCRQLDLTTDTQAFRAGGWVAVELSCTVDLSQLTLLGLPGSRTIQARFVEPLDNFRGPAV